MNEPELEKQGECPMISETDIIVIGSGAAGLLFALEAGKNQRILLITKSSIHESNTKYAQGGIAAVLKLDDNYERHIHDTLIAGDGLCATDTVEVLVHEAPARIRELILLGIEFDRNKDNALEFTREGGHSSRRILHVGDLTGLAIEKSLVGSVLTNSMITVFENVTAIDLIIQDGSCCGVSYLMPDGTIRETVSRSVVLATGGACQLYSHTTNPAIATGDGIAMAHRVGANIVNMEFIQFHPTAFHRPPAPNFLISEAVRGEGGIMVNGKGERFMKRYHHLKELAPRDIVARAIFHEMETGATEHVWLDISFKDSDYLKHRFPTIYAQCLDYGVDITQDPIPVSPAAHYICGGIKTSIDGVTNIPGLYAIGEVACTGVHGANRLASNSLLESVVFAYRAAIHADFISRINQTSDQLIAPEARKTRRRMKPPGTDDKELLQNMQSLVDEIREIMWKYAGIIRSNDGLLKAMKKVKKIETSMNSIYRRIPLMKETQEARNLITVAKLILHASQRRKFNAGSHYNRDLIHIQRPDFELTKKHHLFT